MMIRRRFRPAAVLTAALLAVTVGGCSSSGHTGNAVGAPASTPAAPGATASGQTQIVIANFAFQPVGLTVSPGERITVVNHDSTAHTVTASSGHAFDTGQVAPGASATFTAPTTPGAYPYICTIHPFMHGTLTVR
ncbi:cupredoxin domain-containing protein [Streptacidiphilus rugosus]|uniref:cupredoxin domain-containing protein n=1 Tax=Streptacidiphilus rugosus TaxID=405783 RepID=UPI000ABA5002|nr:cupredoxin domain-containing protein [Streptacidiphilus rugosus]